jgi:hypothetical protein
MPPSITWARRIMLLGRHHFPEVQHLSETEQRSLLRQCQSRALRLLWRQGAGLLLLAIVLTAALVGVFVESLLVSVMAATIIVLVSARILLIQQMRQQMYIELKVRQWISREQTPTTVGGWLRQLPTLTD